MQKLLRRRAVEATTGLSKSALYAQVAEGLVPPPVAISARAVAWPESEIHQVVHARTAGKSEATIKSLVTNLVQARSTEPLAQ